MKFIFLFFVLIACSSMDRKTCLTMNWYEKGVADGQDKGEDKFESYKRECHEERVSVSNYYPDYKKGMIEGLRTYCSFQNGFNKGLEGRGGAVMCDNINPAFARGYEEGYREFRVTQRKKRDDEEIDRKYESDMDSFKNKVLTQSHTKECSVDFDCHKNGDCRFNRCSHNNMNCTSDYDCKIRGRCREVKEYGRNHKLLTIRVCDY